MRRKVLILSSCAPPAADRPATGGGLRTAQLVETARQAGLQVVLLVEAAGFPGADHDGVDGVFDAAQLPEALATFRPDVVITEQWALLAALGSWPGPVACDLHGSLLLENLFRRGGLDAVMDAEAKIAALRRADRFFVPAEAQLHHFASWLTLAGFDPRQLPIDLLPLAAPSPREGARPSVHGLHLVYGGARWPWIDSKDALLAAAAAVGEVLERGIDARLDVFTYDPPRHGLPVEDNLGTWEELDRALQGRPGVRLHGAVGHGAWLAQLDEVAHLALDLWTPNPERLLAATTRTVETLARGVPVVTVEGAAWAPALLSSGAGFTVPPGDSGALRALLLSLADDPERLDRASIAARALAADHHTVAAAGDSLRRWLLAPSRAIRANRSLVEGLLDVKQGHLDEALRSTLRAHRAEHEAIVAAHGAEVQALRQSHGVEVDGLGTRHRADVEAIRRNHEGDVAAISQRHREDLATRAAIEDAARIAALADFKRERKETRQREEAALQLLAAEARQERERIVADADRRLSALRQIQEEARAAADQTRREEAATWTVEHDAALRRVHAERDQQLQEVVGQWEARTQAIQERATGEGTRLLEERLHIGVERDAALAERDALRSERDGLRAGKEALQAERDSMIGERSDLRAERDGLRAAGEGHRSERDALRRDRDLLAGERDALRAERDRLLEEGETVAAGVRALEGQIEADRLRRLAAAEGERFRLRLPFRAPGRSKAVVALARLAVAHATDRD